MPPKFMLQSMAPSVNILPFLSVEFMHLVNMKHFPFVRLSNYWLAKSTL